MDFFFVISLTPSLPLDEFVAQRIKRVSPTVYVLHILVLRLELVGPYRFDTRQRISLAPCPLRASSHSNCERSFSEKKKRVCRDSNVNLLSLLVYEVTFQFSPPFRGDEGYTRVLPVSARLLLFPVVVVITLG